MLADLLGPKHAFTIRILVRPFEARDDTGATPTVLGSGSSRKREKVPMNRSRLMNDKRRGKGSLKSAFVRTFAGGAPAALVVAVACSHGNSAGPAQNYQQPPPPPPPNGTMSTGPCSPEGVTQPCDVNLGKSNGILNCFKGTQSCVNGVWSSCGGSGVVSGQAVSGVVQAASTAGDVHIQGTVTPPPVGGSCTLDPCNPYCQTFESDAGNGLKDNGEGGSVIFVPVGQEQFPGGFGGKLFSDACNGGTPCDGYATGSGGCPDGGGSSGNITFFACQLDTYCDIQSAGGGDGCCHQFVPGQYYGTAAAAPLTGSTPGVDLTVGPACYTVSDKTYDTVPICNRGSALLPAGGNLTLALVAPAGQIPPTACPACNSLPATCSMPIPVGGLAPGACTLMYLPTACGFQPSGNNLAFVNPDCSVVESTLTPDPALCEATQPGCANNWGDANWSQNNPPSCSSVGATSQTYTETYTASCPAGTVVNWNDLTYDANVPTNSSGESAVVISATTAPLLPDGGTGAFTSPPVQLASVSQTGDPALCQMSGPVVASAPNVCQNNYLTPTDCCPKNIQAAFEGPAPDGFGPITGLVYDQQAVIQLQIRLTSTPDNHKLPTLYWWEILYSCVPSE